MEIILKNLPVTNEEVYLIFESSLLNENVQILNNNNKTNTEKTNEIIISQNKYKYSNIDTKIENGLFSNIMTNQLIKKNDLALLLVINKNQSESDNNINNFINKEINNIINKVFFERNKIKQITYNYYKINLEKNNIDNIIKDKTLNKDSENGILLEEKDNKEENSDLSLLQIKFDYLDDIANIPVFVKIFFIYNSFEKIIPLFSIDKKEKQILILKEKINNLLLLENKIKENFSKLSFINNDFIQDLNIYKNEVTNYFENFVNNVNIDKNENKAKNNYNNKNNLNELIKEAKILLDNINKEQFKNREKDIYQKYIQIYSNVNKDNKFDIYELKKSINNFNNLNEELLKFLEKEKHQKESKYKDKEIFKLKQKINQLEKDLQIEKDKSQQKQNNNNNTDNIQTKNSKTKQRSLSALKINNNNKSNNNNNNVNSPYINRLEDENKKLKRNIEELKETISQLKSKNKSLSKENEKLLKEKNTSSNYNNLKNNNKDNKDNKDNKYNKNLLNSPKKTTNQSIENSNQREKKDKILNKTKTNNDLLFNGNSLLLLKKIQEENKELSKQLKDFSSKNIQLELSLRGINGTEMKQKNKNNNSLLYNFTKNTREELKNIEKKYGLVKNK